MSKIEVVANEERYSSCNCCHKSNRESKIFDIKVPRMGGYVHTSLCLQCSHQLKTELGKVEYDDIGIGRFS